MPRSYPAKTGEGYESVLRVLDRCRRGDHGTVRIEFHQQLDSLNADLARMCELAGEAMQRATLALLTAFPQG